MKQTTAIAAIVIALLLGIVGGTQMGTSNAAASPTPTPAAPTFPGSRTLEKAQKEAAANNMGTAVDTLAEALRELEEAAPLRILSLRVVQTPTAGYGLWTELPGKAISLSKKDPLILYFEPSGFSRKKNGDVWSSDMIADVALYAPQLGPEPFLKQTDFVGSKLDSHRPNRELFYVMTLKIDFTGGGPPAGEYVAEVTLRDNISGEKATERVIFKIVP